MVVQAHRVAVAAAILIALALAAAPAGAANYVISTTGNDAWAGDAAHPWATLQKAANTVRAGDYVDVLAGNYAGAIVSSTNSGTASARITFHGEPGATVNSPEKWGDGIDLEGPSYITVEGFTLTGNGMPSTNPDGSKNTGYTRAGLRAVNGTGVILRNNSCDNWGSWGILTGFENSMVIENNVTTNTVQQHGIYFSNSGDYPTIRGNLVYGNAGSGIQINPDISMGGDGMTTGALVTNNIVHDNGIGRTYLSSTGRSYTWAGGGGAFNFQGLDYSTIQNNLLYNNYASGLTLYWGDAAMGSTNNNIVNNTILMPHNAGRNAVLISGSSNHNTFFNNIIFADRSLDAAINVGTSPTDNSLVGLVSDYNLLGTAMGYNDDGSTVTLASWRATTGQDAHSLSIANLAALNQIFMNTTSGDYHLLAGGLAVNAGTNTILITGTSNYAPLTDLGWRPRPVGGRFDLGAYEWLMAGDVNGDNVVNLADLTVLATCYGAVGKQWCDGDFNGDGLVNLADLTMLATTYGWSGGGDLSVPEPMPLALVLVGAMAAALPRRRAAAVPLGRSKVEHAPTTR